ncbi:MAG: hypothetical protein JXR53_02190 [Bacteroidales bacterium]|nr:hypothetical protein [Bacteroidales bacterium]
MRKVLFLLVFLALMRLLHAQDTIVLNSGSKIVGFIIQARTDSVLYSLDPSAKRVFSLSSEQIADMRFGNTRISRSYTIPSNTDTLGSYRNSLKTGFLAPAFGHLYFSYEKALKNNISLDVYLGGIIDQNNDYYYYGEDNSYGGYLRVGFRFYFNNLIKRHGRKLYSPLAGHYFSIIMSHTVWQYRNYYYLYDDYWGTSSYYGSRSVAYSGSMHWLYGLQVPIAKRLNFNVCAGLGYSFTVVDGNVPYDGFEYSHAKPFNGPFSVTGMIQFGYIF